MGILGDELEAAMAEAKKEGHEFKLVEGDTRLALCAISSYREPHQRGKLTLSAGRREHGYIILGPLASRHAEGATMEDMLKFTKVRRWALNKVPSAIEHREDVKAIDESNLSDGDKEQHKRVLRSTITGSPSIVLMSRIRLVCTRCGHTSVEWRDNAMKRMARGGEAGITCNLCKKADEAVGAPVRGTQLTATLFNNTGNELLDPIFTRGDTKVLEQMFEVWKSGTPRSNQSTVGLPRVWCVYPKASIPDMEWEPSDERARLISSRAEQYMQMERVGDAMVKTPHPLGILPFAMARKFHQAPEPQNKTLEACWLDVPELDVGWVRMQDLLSNPEGGFKRELWYSMEARTGVKTPTV